MDARDALRQYLEQRRDQGESELVLDTMSVDEALAALGAPAGLNARRTGPAPVAGAGAGHDWGKATVPDVRVSSAEPSPSADWRETIRAAGGAPDVAPARARAPRSAAQKPDAPVSPPAADGVPHTDLPAAPPTERSNAMAAVPSASRADAVLTPLSEIPLGLSVGDDARVRHDDPLLAAGTLEELAATIAGCRRCPLYATALNPVPGAGNSNADFMIVGEAPGANEDAQGVPFVGQAGQLLTKIIAAIDLGRDDVFIANVLKHRPPGNRNPLPDEVAACSPYLVRQIELVQPKVILALGTFAAQTLLETRLTIGKLRGQVHRYHGVPLIVTYHPAALLRNPAWKRPTWEDVQLARRILDRARPSGT